MRFKNISTIVNTVLILFALASNMQGQSIVMPSNEDNTSHPMPDYNGIPWITRTTRPYSISRGLDGRHLSVWASHGRYFDNTREQWQWQRPFLFCTTEDLLSQSFVYPFLIPMLEHAGATVFTPRERDYQQLEAIVDGDTPSLYGTYDETGNWQYAGPGFGMTYTTLNDTIQPFRCGTARFAPADGQSSVLWMPQIPATGFYAVYVSYPTLPNSTDCAIYTVHHCGRTTNFRVNQQMGGGTWVYLGTFRFDEGQSLDNSVTLSATGANPEGVISADAVRFGGGRSRVERSNPTITESYRERIVNLSDSTSNDIYMSDSFNAQQIVPRDTVVVDTLYHYSYDRGTRSGLPCYLEAARYYTQWAGLEESLFTSFHGLDDYKDDLRSRSFIINRLAGGSIYQPDTIGRRVPLELQFALHTDAGFHRSNAIYGSLTISTDYDDSHRDHYCSGLSRSFANEYADFMLNDVATDLSRLYGVSWPQRECRVANYSETRSPQIPAVILELLSHQNFRDMRYAHDPNFRFDASRSIYKSILRTVYRMHGLGAPVIQPLPVTHIAANITSNAEYTSDNHGTGATALISWQATIDSLESSAIPSDYVLYVRQDDGDWDEGTVVPGNNKGNTLTNSIGYAESSAIIRGNTRVKVLPGIHYQMRVTALNAGGESFPSEPVSIYVASNDTSHRVPRILVVNAFDRLSGPAFVEKSDSVGFDLGRDIGVAYGVNTSICGAQTNFNPTDVTRSNNPLGQCGTEYTGVPLAGNTFDGIRLHTNDILNVMNGRCTIVSMSRAAFDQLSDDDLKDFDFIDYIAGLQADVPHNMRHYDIFSHRTYELLTSYEKRGGRIFVSGSYLGQTDSLFLANTLHAINRGSLQHTNRGTFYGLNTAIPIFNAPSAAHYSCQESNILEPASNDAFCPIVYGTDASNAYSAAVAWPNGVTLAFPYDCISDETIRKNVMAAILQHCKIME